MKKTMLFLAAVAALVFSACGSDDEPTRKTRGSINLDALVTLNPAAGVQIRAVGDADSDTPFPAAEIVKRAHSVNFYTHYSGQRRLPHEIWTGTGFAPEQKDTINGKLKFWGTSILDDDGLVKSFINGRDFVIVGGDYTLPVPDYNESQDTLGYIPRAVIEAARIKIEQAYADSNYTEVYRLFDEAFTYIPCTAKQYKALKAKGLN